MLMLLFNICFMLVKHLIKLLISLKKIIIIITDHKLLNIVTQNLFFELMVLFNFLFIKNITGPKKS